MPIPVAVCVPSSLEGEDRVSADGKRDKKMAERHALFRTAEAMKQHYLKQSELPSLLAIFPEFIEMALTGTRQSGT